MTIVLSPLLHRLALAAAATLVFLLFYLGSQPVAVDLFLPPWDKLAHFGAFGGLAGLLALGATPRQPLRIILLVALIGVIDEWHQLFLPGRSADLMDFLADVAAAVAAVTLVEWLRLRGFVEDGQPAADN